MANKSDPAERALTRRGVATRARIVEIAAGLIYINGVERVSLDTVMEASGASKSQLYHYFQNKAALVREVIAFQAERILAANSANLQMLDSFEALHAWRDAMVATSRANGLVGGCPLGSLASELSAHSEEARMDIARDFDSWAALIALGLESMKTMGKLRAQTDARSLSIAVLAAIQGGLLLSKAARASEPLELAFAMALDHIRREAV